MLRALPLLIARPAIVRLLRQRRKRSTALRPRWRLWLGPGKQSERLTWPELLRLERETRWQTSGLLRSSNRPV